LKSQQVLEGEKRRSNNINNVATDHPSSNQRDRGYEITLLP